MVKKTDTHQNVPSHSNSYAVLQYSIVGIDNWIISLMVKLWIMALLFHQWIQVLQPVSGTQ